MKLIEGFYLDEFNNNMSKKMKKVKKILIVIITLLIVSCSDNYELKRGDDYNIVVVDSCEYIFFRNYRGGMIHKGNCKNPHHIEMIIKEN